MHPAFSILCFTTLAGAAQGLVVLLALAQMAGVPMPAGFLPQAVLVAGLLLLGGLGASFLHLGRKTRAWRAVLMWRTSWMSREVILLPAFIGLVAVWWLLLLGSGRTPAWLPPLLVLASLALWVCTAMIYACLRFVEEWAHPLTVVNFTLLGLSSGCVLAGALAAWADAGALARVAGACALATTLAAWYTRQRSLRRNDTLRHRSTLHSATGLPGARLVQMSMGMSAGSFNTREFFHGAPAQRVRLIRRSLVWLAFVLPAALLLWAALSQTTLPLLLAALVQAPGLLAERWIFFAQARHPQNLYYQSVG